MNQLICNLLAGIFHKSTFYKFLQFQKTNRLFLLHYLLVLKAVFYTESLIFGFSDTEKLKWGKQLPERVTNCVLLKNSVSKDWFCLNYLEQIFSDKKTLLNISKFGAISIICHFTYILSKKYFSLNLCSHECVNIQNRLSLSIKI